MLVSSLTPRLGRPTSVEGAIDVAFPYRADGTPRMFMERGSEVTPLEGRNVSDDFVGATFGGKWKFPKVGK